MTVLVNVVKRPGREGFYPTTLTWATSGQGMGKQKGHLVLFRRDALRKRFNPAATLCIPCRSFVPCGAAPSRDDISQQDAALTRVKTRRVVVGLMPAKL